MGVHYSCTCFFCVFNKKRKFFVAEETSGLHKKELLKVSWIFSNFNFWGDSVNRNSIIMISKGYHYVINLRIASNCLDGYRYQCRSCLSWILGKRPIVAGKLGRVWVLPYPKILKPIIHDGFSEGIIGTAPIMYLCFIFTIPLYFIYSAV